MNKRAQRILENGGNFSCRQFEVMKKIFDRRCVKCGDQPSYLAADHIVPVSRGGPTTWNNIQPLCRTCNSKKGDRETIDYRVNFLNRIDPRYKFFTLVRFYVGANYSPDNSEFQSDCQKFFELLGASKDQIDILLSETEGLNG